MRLILVIFTNLLLGKPTPRWHLELPACSIQQLGNNFDRVSLIGVGFLIVPVHVPAAAGKLVMWRAIDSCCVCN